MEELPFGYTHRQKRSHAQMEAQEQSASPAWPYNRFSHPRDPIAFGPHLAIYDLSDPRTPSFDPTPQQPSSLYGPTHSLPHSPAQRPATTAVLPHPHRAGLHLPRVDDMPASTLRRFIGDGFDYRRPASSAPRDVDATSVDLTGEEEDAAIDLSASGEDEVIDLTADDSGYGASLNMNNGGQQHNDEEQRPHGAHRRQPPTRLPRGMDIIIDLDNGEEEWSMDTPAPEPGSPEIEFISSRPIDQPRHARNRGPAHADGDEVEFLRENTLPADEVHRRRLQDMDNVVELLGTMNGRFTHLQAHVARFTANINRTAANMNRAGGRAERHRRGPIAPPRGPPRPHAHVHVGAFMAPVMDWDMVGFDMGMAGARAPDPPPPTYEAPPKAPAGFTRGPEEKDVLVCPNCGDELCGSDDEMKNQVWIVKACGHVYCGECTANRSVKRSAKGKEKPVNTPPFKACVVEDCGKSVVHRKTMIQVFL